MPNEAFAPRADMVDGEWWIETSITRAATIQLHATLELARQPDAWTPFYCLAGPGGSGKTALAQRVARQAQRNVACRLAGDVAARGPAFGAPGARAGEALVRSVAEDFGHCPMACAPMRYAPVDLCKMAVRPDGSWHSGILHGGKQTPGDHADDPLRRTSLVMIDRADHLLNLGEAKRRYALDQLLDWPGRRFAYVFIGSPRLAAALAEHGKTQVIPLPGLPDGAEFAAVADMVFGTRDPSDVARIHRASGGCMGPLLHMASMKGLAPPFNVPDRDIARLPPPSR